MTANAKPKKKGTEVAGRIRFKQAALGVYKKGESKGKGQCRPSSRVDREILGETTMSKVLQKGDNHLTKARFIGAEVPDELYQRFTKAAKASNRSRSGLIRHLIENADVILSGGDNHLSVKPRPSTRKS